MRFNSFGVRRFLRRSYFLPCFSFSLCLAPRVKTSGRRWEKRGTLRTIALMWRLRLEYALGADPAAIARRYER